MKSLKRLFSGGVLFLLPAVMFAQGKVGFVQSERFRGEYEEF